MNLSRYVEKEIQLDERLMNLDISHFESNEAFPCVDEIILIKLMTNIKNDIIDPEDISDICDKRRVGAWYENLIHTMKAFYNMGKMKDFYNKNQASFHMTSAKEVWKSIQINFI